MLGKICSAMKVFKLLLPVLVLGINLGYGQKSEEFGNVSVKELSAVVIFERHLHQLLSYLISACMELEPNSVASTVYKRHMRIKILNSQGRLANMGEITDS
jgi:hypothetical protein